MNIHLHRVVVTALTRSTKLAVPAVLALVILVPACSRTTYVQPEVQLSVIKSGPCLWSHQSTVPMDTSIIKGQAQETVNVCIANHSFPFIIDTGAVQSSVNAQLAADLGLATVGPKQTFAGLGCLGTYRQVKMSDWSLSGVPLPSVVISAETPRGMGKAVGLLGADVLSRYGSVRLDFAAKRLVLDASPATGTNVPVHHTPGNLDITTQVRVAGRPRTFLIDTGASQSAVDSSVHLASAGVNEVQDTLCSQVTVPVVNSGKWSIDGMSLSPEQIGSTGFGDLSESGITGLLGDDELIRHEWVILNFRTTQMTLGPS